MASKECWRKQLWQQEHEWSSWSSVRKQREIKASAHVSTSVFSLEPQLMDWCHYFLKHTSVLPLLGTEAPISRKVNQFWDFLLSFTGRELLSTWRQQPSGLKSKYKEGGALSRPNHHKHDFSHTGNQESPMITHSPGSIFCFSAHHFMLCECLPPCLKLLSTAF